jgi:flagellum-specific peptidoglycan hydrolase FlgJ
MSPKEFTLKYYKSAMDSEAKTRVPHLVILAQAALESGWGNVAPGNMFFGKKDSDGLNGNEQLLLTTEYLDNPDKKFPAVLSVVQVGKKALEIQS